MKDYAMKIRVSGKDHALSFGPRVALPDLLRDHLMLTGTKKSRNRQYMTNAETETGTQTKTSLARRASARTAPTAATASPIRCRACRSRARSPTPMSAESPPPWTLAALAGLTASGATSLLTKAGSWVSSLPVPAAAAIWGVTGSHRPPAR
jgi:hypothetical protein